MFGIPVIAQGWFEKSLEALKEKPLETIFKLDTQLKAALIDPLVNFNKQRLSEIASELRKFTAWYEDEDMKNKVHKYPPFHSQMQGWIYMLEFIEILSQCQPLKDDWEKIHAMSYIDKIMEDLEIKCMITFPEISNAVPITTAQVIERLVTLKELQLICSREYGGVEYYLLTPRGYSMLHKYIKT